MPEVASQTLDFVGRELNITLAEARTALENYVEQPDNVTLLERCTLELHQVQGVLRVLEIYGAALLAEEMEQVASYLLATATERKSQAESLDALMRAMVQLPSYLERVLAGGRDLALVLLPLLNDLRAVRGSALLSEGTLLLLNLKSDKQAQPIAAAPGEPPLTVEQWARRLRARFQVGLIGWIRGERTEQNLDILAAVAQKLEQIATRQPLFQLWWVIGAIIEALQESGIEGGVSVKRLLGLGDREIRRLYEQGEARYSQSPAVELLNNLLYYVGRAESSGPRVTAVRASFRLSELLPVDESIEQERENLSAPSVKLMQTVAAAIREDLSKVKDVLDIFVRRGAGQPKELLPQVELLRKIGDTLGVLGLGELRGKVQGETERLEKIVNGTLKADEATLVTIAATLIGVEDRLDDSLVGMIRPKNNGLEEPNEDVEFQQVQSAVLRECILNLARIKEAITQNVGGTLDAAGLDSWQELMRGMKAGLLMLGKARAVEVIEAVTGQLKRVMQPGGRALPVGFMDRLADAIVSVEYYMETLQAGRSDPWYMLDNAQSCVQALEQQQTPSVPTVPALDPAAFAKTVQISNATGTFVDIADPSATLVGVAAPTISPSRTQKVAALAESADPELVKLFIEEAHEELVKIQRYFPAWDQNPMERDSLVTVRRSFHTLKGSGRMVGARELGEFAWSIENLLNRVLDNTLTRTPGILGVLREAVAALPELIEQLETGRKPRADMVAIADRAHALAAGRQPGTPRLSAPVEQAEATAAEQPPGGTATIAVTTLAGAPKPLSPQSRAEGQFASQSPSQTATVVALPSAGSPTATSQMLSSKTSASSTSLPQMTTPPASSAAASSTSTSSGSPSAASSSRGSTPSGATSSTPPWSGSPSAASASHGSAPSDAASSTTPWPGSPSAASSSPGSVSSDAASSTVTSPGSPSATSSSAGSAPSGATSSTPPWSGSPSAASPSPGSALSTPASSSPSTDAAPGSAWSTSYSAVTPPGSPSSTIASAFAAVGSQALGSPSPSQSSALVQPGSSGSSGAPSAGAPPSALGQPASSGPSSVPSAGAPPSALDQLGSSGPSGVPSAGAPPSAFGQPASSGSSGAPSAGAPPSAFGQPASPGSSGALSVGASESAFGQPAASQGGSAASIAGQAESSAAGPSPSSSFAPPGPASAAPSSTTSASPGASPTPPSSSGTAAATSAASSANVAAPAPDSSDDGKPAGLDEVLREIYARETNTHIATVRAYLEREEGLSAPHVLPEEVYRACHTLSGSSKMAQARHGTRIAEPLDHWLRRAFSSGPGLQQQDLTLLADCMHAMETVATHLDEPTGYFVTHWQLQERIAEADKTLDQRIAAATAHSEDQSLSPADELMSEEGSEATDDAGDFDPEVAAIFTEEATELIEASEHALSDWRAEPASAEYRSALKRPLHTLKGGARMAGIMAMGDLSHELETLVMQVDNGSVAANDGLFEVVQASLDELARMREQVANGRRVSPARAMVARIHALSRPKAAQPASSTPPTSRAAGVASPPGSPNFPGSVSAPASPSSSEFAGVSRSPSSAALAGTAAAAAAAGAASLADSHASLGAGTPAPLEPVVSESDRDTARMAAGTSEGTAHTSDTVWPGSDGSLEPPQAPDRENAEFPLLTVFTSDSDDSFNVEGLTGSPTPDGDDSVSDPISPAHFVADALLEGGAEPGVPSEAPPEQSWMKESPQAPWQTPAANSEDDPNTTAPTDAGVYAVSETQGDVGADDIGAYTVSETPSDGGANTGVPDASAYMTSEGSRDSDATVVGPYALSEPENDADASDAGAYTVSETQNDSDATDGGTADAGVYVVSETQGEAGDLNVGFENGGAYGAFEAPAEGAAGGNTPEYGVSGASNETPVDFDVGPAGPDGAFDLRRDVSPAAGTGSAGNADAGIIVIEESPGFDALPTVDAAAPEIERLAATGSHAALPASAATSAAAPTSQGASPSLAKSVSISFERRAEPRSNDDGLLPPQPVPPGREPVAPVERQEMARVDAELLDQLLNISGEASIARSRLEQQLGSFDFNLGELSRTVTRLKEQLRSLEIETEAQILHRHEDEGGHRSEFDPLELDRYSSIQQFSRALAETANDVASIQQLLENLAKDTQTLLQQQARTITELQNGLMRTRMVPFQRHVQRLARIVRQAASDTHKRAELIVEGASGELDRQVLERMLPPFEHMLRNAVVHGIEKPEDRVRAGKPEAGRIVLELHREGAEVMVRLTDDGGGMNLKAIRDKGLALGLIAAGQTLSDEDAMQLILEPGFSTAGAITQQAGRGVGMDVVATEIKRLGGALHMESKAGEGTVFTIRLPFTLAISHALVVRTGEEFYALPLPTVEGVLRLSKAEVTAHLGRDASAFDYGGQKYRFQHLATFVSLEPSPLPEQDVTIPVVLVRAGEHSTGLVADELIGSREIVVKSVGPQISSIRGISGATILGDGRIVIILDIGALVRAEWRTRPQTPVVPKEKEDKRVFAMVVDDSITVRRVTQRLLERNGMRVLTARDGMDAVTLLQDNVPDVILLDIEMPRMDGYEVAAHVRNDPRLKDVPIIMITSRVGEKHRARAIELGVDDYLGKPYQEAQLLEAIAPLVERRRMAIGSHLYAAEIS